MGGYFPKRGDTVRVSKEGKVSEAGNTGTCAWFRIEGSIKTLYDNDGWTIEQVEEPVEVFKPGDRLKRVGSGSHLLDGYEVTLADDGYLHHISDDGGVVFSEYGDDHDKFFTSENFIKLDVAELPF